MTNKKSIAKNYLYTVSYQILAIIIPLITTPYLSRVLGAEAIGIYSYTLSVTTYFVLVGSLGVALYGRREIACVQDDIEKRSKTFWEILLFRFITLVISLIIFYFSFVNEGEYSIYYKILILELIATMIDISWFFQGLEEFKKTVIRNACVRIISVILIFTLVKSSNDLIIYFIIYVLSNFLGNITLWMYLPKFITKVEIKKLNILRHIKPTIALFIPQISTEIFRVLDRTILGSIVEDKAETGYYEQAQKLVKLLITLVTSLGTVMLPRMAAEFAKNEKAEIQKNIKKSFNFVFFLAIPITLGIIMVSDIFVPLFYGKGYEKVSFIIKIISPVILAFAISNVTGTQYLIAAKRQKEFTISVVIGAVLNVIANFILIPKLASIGAAISTVIAEVSVAAIQLFILRKELSIKDIFKTAINYVVAGILMCIVCLIIANNISNDIVSISVQIIVGAITYFTYLIIVRDKFINDIFNKMKQKMLIKL